MKEFLYKKKAKYYLFILSLIYMQCISHSESVAENRYYRNLASAINSKGDVKRSNRFGINKIAEKITVMVKSQKANSSGVLISRKGNNYKVMTAWHAVKRSNKNETIKIITADMKIHHVTQKNIHKIPFVDMAILRFESSNEYEIARIGNISGISMGNNITAVGYIDGKLYVTKGRVIANSGFKVGQGLQIIYTNKIIPGMSGGPIMNKKGELVGINGTTNHHLLEDGEGGGYAKGIPAIYYLINDSNEKIKLSKIDDYIVRSEDMISKNEDYKKIIKTLSYANKKIRNTDYNFTKQFIYRKLCELKTISKDYLGAVSDCSKIIELKPNESNGYTNRCSAYAYLKEIEKAGIDCKKAIEINSNNAQAYTNLCFTMYISKEYEKAKIHCNKAIEIDNIFDQAYTNRCAVNISLLDIKKASLDCKKALDINKENALAYTNLCYINLGIGKYKEAINYCNNAINIDKDIHTAYLNRCAIKLSLGDNIGAISDCKKSRDIDSNSEQVYSNICLGQLNIGEIIRAKTNCEKALEINPKMLTAIINLSVINIEIKNYLKAIYYANKAIEIDENYRLAYINRGIAKYELRDREGACLDWYRAYELGSKKVSYLLNKECIS